MIENLTDAHLLGTPIQDANVISYRVCPGYGVHRHDLLCWTSTAESGAHFAALDLQTDGLDIKPIGHLEAYPLTPASDGAIYVGSTTGEIWRYRAAGSLWEVLARPWDNSGGYGVHHIRVLCEGKDGWLYCGSCYGERARVNRQSGEVQRLPAIPEDGSWYVSAVAPLPDGRLAFGCGHVARLFVYDPAQGRDVAQWAPESWRDDGFCLSLAVGNSVLFARHFPSGRRGAFALETGEFLGEAPWPPDVAYPRWSSWSHSSGYGSGIDFYVIPGTDTIATCDGQEVFLWNPGEGGRTIQPQAFFPPAALALEMRYAVTTDLKVLEYDRVRLKVLEERTYEQPRVERGLFGLGIGPDGCVYGGAYQSTHLFRYDPRTNELRDLGDHNPGWSGETYSFCRRGQELVCASYTHGAVVLYDPARPWQSDSVKRINPRFVGCFGQYTYRPLACTATSDGRVWGVGPAGWGSSGGGVSWVDPESGRSGSTRLATAPFAIAELEPGRLIVSDGTALRWWDAHRNEEIASAPWPGGSAGAAVLLEAEPVPRLACADGRNLSLLRLPQPGTIETEITSPLPVAAGRLLWEGQRLIAGGSDGIAEFDPETGQWTTLCSMGPGCQYAFAATPEAVYFTHGPNLYRVDRHAPSLFSTRASAPTTFATR